MKLKCLTAPTLSSDKQNGGQKLKNVTVTVIKDCKTKKNKDCNSLSKFQHDYFITKQSAKPKNNN